MYSICTVKNIRISTDIVWRVFRNLTKQVPHTFLSVNLRTGPSFISSLFCRFTDTNAYGTGSVEIQKTRCEISVDKRVFLTVYSEDSNLLCCPLSCWRWSVRSDVSCCWIVVTDSFWTSSSRLLSRYTYSQSTIARQSNHSATSLALFYVSLIRCTSIV